MSCKVWLKTKTAVKKLCLLLLCNLHGWCFCIFSYAPFKADYCNYQLTKQRGPGFIREWLRQDSNEIPTDSSQQDLCCGKLLSNQKWKYSLTKIATSEILQLETIQIKSQVTAPFMYQYTAIAPM